MERSAVVVAAEQAIRADPCDRDMGVEYDPALLKGAASFEREAHDCQRLLRGDEYGPLVGIFPVAHAVKRTDAEFGRGWVAAASLFNWGGRSGERMAYDALGIAPGLNCLLLRRQGDDEWAASIEPASVDLCPNRQDAPGSEAMRLVVKRQIYVGPDRPWYPRTARIMWDSASDEYYFGIKCGDGWCSAGLDPAIASKPDTLPQADLLRSVPGFYDEQPLAVYDSVAKTLRRGPVARIYPTRELHEANAENAPPNAWSDYLHVATFEVDIGTAAPARVDYYRRKFGLEEAVVGSKLGKANLMLRAPVGGKAEAHARRPMSGGTFPADTVDVVTNVQHAADGAVRWRWSDTDEMAWVGCQKRNCCTIGFE